MNQKVDKDDFGSPILAKHAKGYKDIQFKNVRHFHKFASFGHWFTKMNNTQCEDEMGQIIRCDPESWVTVRDDGDH